MKKATSIWLVIVLSLLAIGATLAYPYAQEYQAEKQYREIKRQFLTHERNRQKSVAETPEEYEAELKRLTENFTEMFAQMAAIKHPVIDKRVAFLENYYGKLYSRFADMANCAKLNASLSSLTPAKIKTLESAEPTLTQLKSFVQSLAAFQASVDNDYEQLRADLAKSGLPDDNRRELWSSIDHNYLWLRNQAAKFNDAGKLVEKRVPKIEWLIVHRANFTVDDSGKIVFSDFHKYNEFSKFDQR